MLCPVSPHSSHVVSLTPPSPCHLLPHIPALALAGLSAPVACFIPLLPGENSLSSLEDRLGCHLLLEAFHSSSFPDPNPPCASLSCLQFLCSYHSFLSLLVILSPPWTRAGAGHDSSLGCWRDWPRAGKQRGAQLSVSPPSPLPEVQNAMDESHILEKMAAEAGKKRPGMKPIKGITE